MEYKYFHTELSGDEFNRLMNGKLLCKILSENLTHHGFLYNEGLNVDTNKFDPSGECRKGGLYFCLIERMHMYTKYGNNIAIVTIPNDARVYVEKFKFKSDKLIIGKISSLEEFEFDKHMSDNEIEKMILHYPMILDHINKKYQTPELCMKVVQNDGCSISCIDESLLTPELCIAAIKKNYYAFYQIPINKRTIELSLEIQKLERKLINKN